MSEAVGRALASWRAHRRHPPAHPSLSIGVAASFTAEALVPFLGSALLDLGESPAITVAPFNQLFQVCLDWRTCFADVGVIVLLWRTDDLVGEEEDATLKLDQLAEAVAQLRASFGGTIIVSLPPAPRRLDRAGLDAWKLSGARHHALWSHWCRRLAEIPRLQVLDLDEIERRVGASFDARRWYLYRQPFSDAFLLDAGAALARLLRATRVAPRKCVVLDCDNTLWGGVVGEDGIELGDELPGSAYRDFQKLLRFWQSRGVLLALLSRNNEADVWEVFDRHDGMVLERKHISAWRIDWERKVDNLPLIAAELHLTPSALIFIDDSAFEIEAMRRAWPEVECLLCPDDPADLLERFQGLPLLDTLQVTEEDRQRAAMVETERERMATSRTQDFLATLELEVELFAVEAPHLARVAQLINKTNQFNLTTIRRSEDQLAALLAQPGFLIRAARVRDRFGDYGLTAVAVLERSSERSFTLDTFLMSCRVLGRGVESAILDGLVAETKRLGGAELYASFIPTAKNAPAAEFLPKHGFTRLPDGRWRL